VGYKVDVGFGIADFIGKKKLKLNFSLKRENFLFIRFSQPLLEDY